MLLVPIDRFEVLDEVARGHELIESHFRKLRGAVQDLVMHQERRRDFHIGVLAGVQVEHELTERPLEPGKTLLENHKPRAGQFRRDFEIHLSQRFAELEMLLRNESVIPLRPELVVLHIGVLVEAVGDVVGRQIGDTRQRLFEFAGCLLLVRLQRRNGVLELGDLRHQRPGPGVVLRSFRFGDFLRGRVAARLRMLEPGDAGAAALVDGDEARGLARKAAPRETAIEGFGVFANPFDVVHTPSSPSRPELPQRPGMTISDRQNR